MPPPGSDTPPLTPALRAWVSGERAQGHDEESLFSALLDAGWSQDIAGRALGLSARETDAMVAARHPSRAPTDTVPTVAVDRTGRMVDAGDKWVEVVRHVERPDLWVFSNFLSADECAALIELARPRLTRSLTVDTQTGGEELNHDRTSQGMFFTRGEDALVHRIEARIARLLRWPVQNGEGLQVLRYQPGAEYKPHHDYFDPREPGTATIVQRGGQRVGTLIMYLQAPDEGGATVFPDIDLAVEPRRGHAVFFSYAEAHPDSLTLHGGEPVGGGEKWIATKWLREREFS